MRTKCSVVATMRLNTLHHACTLCLGSWEHERRRVALGADLGFPRRHKPLHVEHAGQRRRAFGLHGRQATYGSVTAAAHKCLQTLPAWKALSPREQQSLIQSSMGAEFCRSVMNIAQRAFVLPCPSFGIAHARPCSQNRAKRCVVRAKDDSLIRKEGWYPLHCCRRMPAHHVQ